MTVPVILRVYDLAPTHNSWTYWCGVGESHSFVYFLQYKSLAHLVSYVAGMNAMLALSSPPQESFTVVSKCMELNMHTVGTSMM
jgi:hypothetical protein